MALIDISTPKHPSTFASVDDNDFGWLSKWKWAATELNGKLYATRFVHAGGRRVIHMHREILGMKYKDGRLCDHKDSNGLNNSRSNLREANSNRNNWNRRKTIGASSQYKGVHKEGNGRWCARIMASGKRVTIGHFDSEEDAGRAYDAAAMQRFGEFARLNFPS